MASRVLVLVAPGVLLTLLAGCGQPPPDAEPDQTPHSPQTYLVSLDWAERRQANLTLPLASRIDVSCWLNATGVGPYALAGQPGNSQVTFETGGQTGERRAIVCSWGQVAGIAQQPGSIRPVQQFVFSPAASEARAYVLGLSSTNVVANLVLTLYFD